MRKPGPRKRITRRNRGNPTKRRFVQPKTLEEFLEMPKRRQEFWVDVGQIVTEVRGGVPLAQASRKFGRDPQAVRRAAGSALRKRRNGRWAAKKVDRLLRVLSVLTPDGLKEVGLNDSHQTTLVSTITIATISSTLGISEPYAAEIRAGRYRPHPRHWIPLAKLVGFTFALDQPDY